MRRETPHLLEPIEEDADLANAPAPDDEQRTRRESVASPARTGTSVQPGTLLGPYRITGALGAGAMGEVYRARDRTLERDVAIKVLPAAFTADPERLARFDREARVLASLNHPHIAQIYGFEHTGDVRALVLELVEGETLADRLQRTTSRSGQPVGVAVAEALGIARQIADALDAAHEKGIVHRDLKPANVKITPAGDVKVLDFGLAKTLTEVAAAEAPDAPTMTFAPTVDGVVLGSVPYMSPEQARGRSVDRRTDIWALGCVLYEMLTGRRAFRGATASDVLAAILEREPDWNALPRATPPALERLLRLCLEKDPRKRRQSAGDVRIDLDQVQAEPAVSVPAAHDRGSRVARLAWLAVTVVAVAALAVPAVTHLREAPPPEMRLQIVTPHTSRPQHFALSPDGRFIVFVASGSSGGAERLYLRPLDQSDAQPMAGTDGARWPFWSPDSRSVGFFARGELYRVDVAGGPPQALAPAANPVGGAWSAEGTILFAPNAVSPLFAVPAKGGEAAAATALDGPRQMFHAHPSFLPDGRRFLFFAAASDPDVSGLYLASLDGGSPKRLIPTDPPGGAYLAPDRIVFLQQGALLARRFDPERGGLTGDPVTLAAPVEGFSVSATGMVAHRAHHDSPRELVWLDRNGKVVERQAEAGIGPELSPDERRLAFDHTVDGNRDIWVRDLARGAQTRLTTHPGIEGFPLWSPDGSRIAFHSGRNGTIDLWIKPSSGAGEEELLLEQPNSEWPIDWSRDGRFLLYQRSDLGAGWDLWALPMIGADRAPVAVATTPFAERMGEFSPDGRWVAYDTNESGRPEIVVQAFPRASERLSVSTAGGIQPRWSADGTEIYFVAPGGEMMAVPVEAKGSTLELGTPAAIFTSQIGGNPFKQEYTVARDGRFLVNVVTGETSAPPITLILNAKL